MATCQTCHHHWSWKDGIKKAFRFKMKMSCPYCGSAQYMSAKAQKKSINMTMVLQPLWLIPVALGASAAFQISAIAIALGLAFTMAPFLLELSNEEEPLW